MSNPIVPAVRSRKALGLLLGLAIAFSFTTGVDMKPAYAKDYSAAAEKTVKKTKNLKEEVDKGSARGSGKY